jgi:predicted DNA-binding transcriptional regulator YafY
VWAGVHEPDGGGTRVSLGGVDVDDLADRLVRLGTPLTVLAPDDLRETLRRRVLAQLDALQDVRCEDVHPALSGHRP